MFSKSALEPARTPAWSLAARMTAWYAGSAFLLVLAVSGFLYAVLVANLEREDEQLLADEVNSIRAIMVEQKGDTARLQRRLRSETTARQHFQFLVRVLDESGRVVAESPEMKDTLPQELIQAKMAGKKNAEFETPTSKSFHMLIDSLEMQNPNRTWTIQIAMDRTFEEELLTAYRRGLGLVLLVALVVCTFTGYQIARRGLRPLREMAATAGRIRSTTLYERIQTAGLPTDLSQLANTFNEMLDRLEESFARLSRFSADIAHELRTPVNNLRGEVEVAIGKPRSGEEYRELLGSCLEECGRLSRMIDSLLFLARAESTQVPMNAERTELGGELQTVRDFYDAAAADAGLSLTVKVNGPAFAKVDRTLFQRAVGNLVANAVAYTPSGGHIDLSATALNGVVRVEVRDTGCGISAEHLPHVFDRFYRTDSARSSSSGGIGLGLAIVKSIAAIHGGAAGIESVVGKGTRIVLDFPAASEAAPSSASSRYNDSECDVRGA